MIEINQKARRQSNMTFQRGFFSGSASAGAELCDVHPSQINLNPQFKRNV